MISAAEQGPRSTSVENPLQIGPFMQNKPNLRDAQMNVSPVITREYKNKSNWRLAENKPNTNPNKPNSNPIRQKPKMNVNSIVTKDYENICPCGAPKKQTQYKPNQIQFQRQKMLLHLTINGRRLHSKRKAKALPTKALGQHYRQIKYTQLNSDVFTGTVTVDWQQMVEEYRHDKQVAGIVEDSLYEVALTLRHFERLVGRCKSKQITQNAIDKFI